MLAMLYVLLGFSVIVSLFGMVNTIVLSVFERTREIGMLRTIGMTRRQARRMIRHESIITALIGAAMGLGLGVFLVRAGDQGDVAQDLAFALPVADAGRVHAGRGARGHRRGGHARAPRLAAQRAGRAAVRVSTPASASFVAQVARNGSGRSVLARHAGQQLARRELAAVAVDVLAQPVAQRRELAAAELRLDLGQVGAGARPQLGGDQVPERVGREVAEQPGAPVHVLQHALRVVGDLDAEQPVHALVPRARAGRRPRACPRSAPARARSAG